VTDFADRDGEPTAALEDAKEEDAITRGVQGQRESLKNGEF
jgi:hypothetical protein